MGSASEIDRPALFRHRGRAFISLLETMSVATSTDSTSFRTARELLEAAGLSWRVELVPAFAEGRPIPGARAVVRSDRREPIAVVGLRYAPVQNADAFAFLDDLVGAGRAIYEAAGMFGGGRRVWVQARLPGDVWVTREDNVGKYLTLTTSHDGGGSLRAFFTPRRIVCSNTLRAALREAAGTGVSIRHVGDVLGRAREAERLLGLSLKYFDDFAEASRTLAGRALGREALERYFAEVVPLPEGADPSRALATRERLVGLFETGRGNQAAGVRGTLWAALNAVAEYVDHERPTRPGKGESIREKRFESSLWGSGARLKERAWRVALEMAR